MSGRLERKCIRKEVFGFSFKVLSKYLRGKTEKSWRNPIEDIRFSAHNLNVASVERKMGMLFTEIRISVHHCTKIVSMMVVSTV